MVQMLARGARRSRKPHRCFECYHEIPAGTVCDYQTNAYDGRAYTLYSHQDCNALRAEYADIVGWPYDDEGHGPLLDEWHENGEFEDNVNAWRGDYPHAITRMEFWEQKKGPTQ
jgi:hypothetical protein